MSSPHTDLERQKRRHRGPLVGIVILVAVVLVFFLFFMGDITSPEDSLLGDGPNVSIPDDAPQDVPPAPLPAD